MEHPPNIHALQVNESDLLFLIFFFSEFRRNENEKVTQFTSFRSNNITKRLLFRSQIVWPVRSFAMIQANLASTLSYNSFDF